MAASTSAEARNATVHTAHAATAIHVQQDVEDIRIRPGAPSPPTPLIISSSCSKMNRFAADRPLRCIRRDNSGRK
jgi:hypothetical protein